MQNKTKHHDNINTVDEVVPSVLKNVMNYVYAEGAVGMKER